jgi:hypothetical protein
MLLENRRLEELSDTSIENMEHIDTEHLTKLESTLMELARATREVGKAKADRDFAKEEALQEKRKAEETGQKLAKILGSETDQVWKQSYEIYFVLGETEIVLNSLICHS